MSGQDNSGPRLARLRAAMAAANLPAMLVTQRHNVGWLSGFTGSTGRILVTPADAIFATDSRYMVQAAAQCIGYRVHKLATSAPDEITTLLQELKTPRIGFEAGDLSYQLYTTYREKLDPAIALVPVTSMVDDLRLVKDAGEIAAMQAACDLADRAFTHIQPFIKPGATERDVMLELEWFMRKQGGADIAFDTIVASGPRSALPHGLASDRVMETGDLVTLDFGARLAGYCSDITRTVVLGSPTDEQRKVYRIVREALYRSIDAIRAGANGKAVDSVGRDFIGAAGYGDYFGHGLGHSLGRAVHDGPGFSIRSELTLAPGMILTVEPGIYVPGWGGVRIEHDVLVTDSDPRILTHSTTELICL